MVRYSFLVRLSHPLLHAGLSRRIFDHPVRPIQHGLRNREVNLFSSLEINHQLEFCRLFHRNFRWLSAFQDLVHEVCQTSLQNEQIRSIVHERSGLYEIVIVKYRWEPVFCGQLDNSLALTTNEWMSDGGHRPNTFLDRDCERLVDIVGTSHSERLDLQSQTLSRGLPLPQPL